MLLDAKASCFVFILLLFFRLSAATWISTMNPTKFRNSTLTYLLDNGGYAILSAGANPALSSNEFDLTDEAIQERLGNLSSDLTNTFLYSDILGMYDGSSESSFLVILHNDLPDEERTAVYRLGEKYGQESVIYVQQASPVVQQLIYTTGPFSGTYVEGQGYKVLSANATDNYSCVRLCPNDVFTFTLNFNFEQMIAANNKRTKTQLLIHHHARNRIRNRAKQSTGLIR